MPVITLLTDFGQDDTYVGQMKGVLTAMAPDRDVIDLTHAIDPGNILAAAIHLDAAVDAFADDTLHVAVVDPGVGSDRRGIAVRCDIGTLVGPDNGLFSAVLDRYPPKAAVSLEDPALFRNPVSPTFHGRDIFAPVAAHLANGLHLTEFGNLIGDLVRLDLTAPQPDPTGHTLNTHVLLTDHFGNLITDLNPATFDAWLDDTPPDQVSITLANHPPIPLTKTYSDVKPGQPLACFGSSGRLELAIRNGHAAHVLGLAPGQTVSLHTPGSDPRTTDA